jgi:hypothetical protein
MLPKFYQCSRKEQSRKDTIIDAYRETFDRYSIPDDRQYWTLCNFQADTEGNIPKLSEVGQLIDSGLIQLDQVHGVDLLPETIDHNRLYIPKANWYVGELYDQILENLDIFNPAIVNLDTNCMAPKAIRICTKVLRLLNKAELTDVLIVLNVMLTNPRRKNVMDLNALNNRFVGEFLGNEVFLHNAQNWNVYGGDKIYTYHGTGKQGKTILSSLLLWK